MLYIVYLIFFLNLIIIKQIGEKEREKKSKKKTKPKLKLIDWILIEEIIYYYYYLNKLLYFLSLYLIEIENRTEFAIK